MLGLITGAMLLLAVSGSNSTCVLGNTDFYIVRHFENEGRDTQTPREVSFRVFVSDLDELTAIRDKLQSMEMDVKVYDRPDGRTLVNGNITMSLDPQRLSDIRCELTAYLADRSAYYEGWGTGFR